MNDLLPIRCVLMRGGTSRGPFFLASDLPSDLAARDAALLSLMGSGHPLQIDGVGGGSPTTSKAAIISRSERLDADVDYLFAQVRNDQKTVDYSPNCGNMLSAVGPYAIEEGLVPATGERTLVRIHNVNTAKIIEAWVPTFDGAVTYCGEASIDGVPGLAAPIALSFVDAAGAKTGKLLPTGKPADMIDGLEVSCIDCAMPMVMIRASDLGLSGQESAEELTLNTELVSRLTKIRIEAGRLMGLGDVTDKVIPKPVLVAPPAKGGTLTARYFMPLDCHPAFATTGAVGVAVATATPGTVAHDVADKSTPGHVQLEHPSGRIDLEVTDRNGIAVVGLIRTARRLFEGMVFAKPVSQAVENVVPLRRTA